MEHTFSFPERLRNEEILAQFHDQLLTAATEKQSDALSQKPTAQTQNPTIIANQTLLQQSPEQFRVSQNDATLIPTSLQQFQEPQNELNERLIPQIAANQPPIYTDNLQNEQQSKLKKIKPWSPFEKIQERASYKSEDSTLQISVVRENELKKENADSTQNAKSSLQQAFNLGENFAEKQAIDKVATIAEVKKEFNSVVEQRVSQSILNSVQQFNVTQNQNVNILQNEAFITSKTTLDTNQESSLQDLFPDIQNDHHDQSTLEQNQIYLDMPFLQQYCRKILTSFPLISLKSQIFERLDTVNMLFITRSFFEFVYRLKCFVFNLTDRSIYQELGISRHIAENAITSIQQLFLLFIKFGDQFKNQMQQSFQVQQNKVLINGKVLEYQEIENQSSHNLMIIKIYTYLSQLPITDNIIIKTLASLLATDSGIAFANYAHLFCLTWEYKEDKGLNIQNISQISLILFSKKGGQVLSEESKNFIHCLSSKKYFKSQFITVKDILEVGYEFIFNIYGKKPQEQKSCVRNKQLRNKPFQNNQNPAKQISNFSVNTYKNDNSNASQIGQSEEQFVYLGRNSQLRLNKWDYVDFVQGMNQIFPAIMNILDRSLRIEIEKELTEVACRDGFKSLKENLSFNKDGKVLAQELYVTMVELVQNIASQIELTDGLAD